MAGGRLRRRAGRLLLRRLRIRSDTSRTSPPADGRRGRRALAAAHRERAELVAEVARAALEDAVTAGREHVDEPLQGAAVAQLEADDVERRAGQPAERRPA